MSKAIAQERPVGASFARHPKGLAILFFTEMWERFTYYGMRSVLILFLVGAVTEGALGLDDRTASSIYGLYISGTYVLALLGGWIADRLIGPQRAVIGGATIIILGNILLTLGRPDLFYVGLLVIVCGVGLLKPNISVMVGQLYPEGGSRRDSGFSIFYMGISVGALLGSLLVPLCVLYYGWSAAFSLGAVGMAIGLCYFLLRRDRLPLAEPVQAVPGRTRAWTPVFLFLAAITLVVGLAMGGVLRIDANAAATWSSGVIAALALAYFLYLLLFAGLDGEEKRRVLVMIVLFASYAIFYAGFEQGGASLNLFAERYTDRELLGLQVPAGMLQGSTAFFTILLAPVFARLWLSLGRRGMDVSAPAKFAIGMGLLAAGMAVMVVASRIVVSGQMVLPTWLLFSYLLQECGDLCLSPVGLSSMTKLAPARFVGQVMGLWFLALALGNNLAGLLSRGYDAARLETLPSLFIQITLMALGAAVLLTVLSPRLRRMIGDAQ